MTERSFLKREQGLKFIFKCPVTYSAINKIKGILKIIFFSAYFNALEHKKGGQFSCRKGVSFQCRLTPRLRPANFSGVRLLQQVAAGLLRRYCVRFYNDRKRQYIEPRLEYRELSPEDDNIPKEDVYQLIVDGDEAQVIAGIRQIKRDLEAKKDNLLKVGDLNACIFSTHLFQPLFHVRSGGKIRVLPVALNESEFQFVTDLKSWCDEHQAALVIESPFSGTILNWTIVPSGMPFPSISITTSSTTFISNMD